MEKKPVNLERARALDIAFMATRLLDEKYFDDFSRAVKTKNQELFLETCEKAQVSSETAHIVWGMVGKEEFSAMIPGGW